MKKINTYINEAFRLRDDTTFRKKKKVEREELVQIIKSQSRKKHLDLRDYDLTYIDNLGFLFKDTNFETINITGWNTQHVTVMASMFRNCQKLKRVIGIETLDTSNVRYMSAMFGNCFKLEEVDVSHFKMGECTSVSDMFSECAELKSVGDLSHWDTHNLKNYAGMFEGCENLEYIGNIDGWNNEEVAETFEEMFFKCHKLKNFGTLRDWKVDRVYDMSNMFSECYALEEIDMSKWNIRDCEFATRMFFGCKNLKSIGDISKWSIFNTDWASKMFEGCKLLEIPEWYKKLYEI